MKKHPILTVSVILCGSVIFFGLLMTIMTNFSVTSRGIPFSNKIGVIPIDGEITDSKEIIENLISFKKDRFIKGIILRINSPGGTVGASQEIYREVLKTRDEKRIIVSLGDVAASGGYYIAAAGDKIMANPGTITGSIGVIMEFYQFKELSRKIGIGLEVVKSGELKDAGSPYRDMTDKERLLLTELVDNIRDQFITAVAEGRNIKADKVREIADGRIFSGEMALKLGLVDQLGNFQDAVDLTKSLTGIEDEVDLVFPSKSRVRLMDLFFQKAADTMTRLLYNEFKGSIQYKWSNDFRGMN